MNVEASKNPAFPHVFRFTGSGTTRRCTAPVLTIFRIIPGACRGRADGVSGPGPPGPAAVSGPGSGPEGPLRTAARMTMANPGHGYRRHVLHERRQARAWLRPES